MGVFATTYLTSIALSQNNPTFKVTSSPNVVGSGARALGVGGAFMAIADDATAASWNPAALIILEKPEAALMFSFDERSTGIGETSLLDFNYMALSYPFTFRDRNMIVSVNYQRLMDFNSKFHRNDPFTEIGAPTNCPSSPPPPNQNIPFRGGEACYGLTLPGPTGSDIYTINTSTKFIDPFEISDKTEGDIGAIAPAFAIQVTPKISFGMTVNFWRDGIIQGGFKETYKEKQGGKSATNVSFGYDIDRNGFLEDTPWQDTDWIDDDGIPGYTNGDTNFGPTVGDTGEFRYVPPGALIPFETTEIEITSELTNFRGTNLNLGLLFKLPRDFSLGIVYKTPFKATADYKSRYRRWEDGVLTNDDVSEEEREYNFPAVYGIGVAKRFSDRFTLALDVSLTEWDKFWVRSLNKTGQDVSTGFRLEPGFRTVGKKISPINGLLLEDADIDPVTTVRLGAEYLFITQKTIIPVRAGLIYDPEPARSRPDDFYGGSFGTGIMLFDRLLIDAAYVYRFGPDVTVNTVVKEKDPLLKPGHFTIDREVKRDVTHHQVLLSMIYHF